MTLKRTCLAIFTAVSFAVLFFIAINYDLSINQALYNPTNGFALFGEIFGWWPLYLGIPLSGFCLISLLKKGYFKSTLSAMLSLFFGLLLIIAGNIIIIDTTVNYIIKRKCFVVNGFMFCFVIALSCVLIILWAFFTNLSKTNVFKLFVFSLFLNGYMILHNIIITTLKQVFNRTRFDTMLLNDQNFDRFTTAFSLNGNGGTSFPSGHTGAAATVLVLVFFCLLFNSCKGKEPIFVISGLCFAWFVGIGRVIIGRHFLSDATFSILITVLTVAVLWYLPLTKKTFSKLKVYAENLK